MNSLVTERQFRWLIGAAVVVVGLLAYANTFGNEFVWDDASSVLLNKHVQDPGMFFQLFREDQHPFGRGQGNFYRPLVATSFMVDYLVSRQSSAPLPVGKGGPELGTFVFHVTNLAWHIAAALLLFALLTRLGAPQFVRAATALLYVVHPLHTEAVAYISGRADPMSAAFMFAALWFALWNGTAQNRMLGTVLCTVSFVLAVISKESAVITPFLLLLFAVTLGRYKLDENPETQPIPRPWLPFGVAAVIVAGYGALRMTVLHFGSGSEARTLGLGGRLVEVGQAFALYIRLIFVPTGLHMERALDGVPLWVAGAGFAALAVCILIVVGGYALRQWRLATGMAWFLITWLPISGLFPLNAPMAEHWLYVPLAGFLWSLLELVWLLVGKSSARKVAYVVAFAGCAAFMALTARQNLVWRTNESLYLGTLEKNPNSTRIEYNLAVTYGDLLDDPIAARRHYERVIDLYQAKKAADPSEKNEYWSDELESHLSLGRLYVREQQFDRAVPHFALLLSLKSSPENQWMMGPAALGLSQCLIAAGRFDEAKTYLNKAATLAPDLKPDVDQLLRMLQAQKTS